MQPRQLGVGVAGGAETAVHAVRRLVSNMPDDNAIVKLDSCSELLHEERSIAYRKSTPQERATRACTNQRPERPSAASNQ